MLTPRSRDTSNGAKSFAFVVALSILVAVAFAVCSTSPAFAADVKPCALLKVPGVGEAAQYTADSPTKGTALAYLKGKIVTIVYQAPDAAAKKDLVVGLPKTVLSRL